MQQFILPVDLFIKKHININKMVKIYYKIWVDAIVFEQTNYSQIRNWKLYTCIPMTLFPGMNLLTLFLWIRSFTNRKINIFLDIHIFKYAILNTFCSGALTLLVPFIILNYFLIFHNKRYEQLISKYTYRKGKLYLCYMLFTIGILIVPIIVAKWIF